MALSVFDGAEYGVVVAGVGVDTITGSPTIVTSPVRTGLRAWELSFSAAAEHVGYTVANQICSQAFYVRFATAPLTSFSIAHFNNAAGVGKFNYINGTGFTIQIGSGSNILVHASVVANQWYRIVVEYDTSTTTASLKATVDNGTEASTTAVITATNTTSIRLGTPSAETATFYVDDWFLSITDGDYETMKGWASHRVESLIPSSDGTHNIMTSGDFDSFVGTAFSNATTNGFSFIDHRPLQRANTADNVVRQELGTTANYMEFGNENLSDNTDPVDGVRTFGTHVESAASGASLAEARLLLSDNTEVLTTGSLSVINSTEDPGTTVTTRDRMAIDPAGGWDGTKVDGLKWRIGFGDNAPDVNFIDLMVEVAQHELPVDNRAEVSFAELEVPTAVVNNRAEVSWTEFEVPIPNNRAEVSWAEFEVPTLNNRAEVSFAELETPDVALDNRAEVSWTEFEVPIPNNRAEVSSAWLEVPFVDNRAEVSWCALEVPEFDAAPPLSWIPGDDPVDGAHDDEPHNHFSRTQRWRNGVIF